MSRGPIPWRSINDFAQRYGFEGDDFERLNRLVRAMDAQYLAYFRKDTE